jgi:ketosteroid isomerase-like protein
MRLPALIAALVLLSACRDGGSNEASGESALRAAMAEHEKALIAGDAAALDRLYANDYRVIDYEAKIGDKQQQIRLMTKEADLLDGRSDDVRISMLGQDHALITGRFTGRYRYRGEEADFTERYTSLWMRNGENWRLKHEHMSMQPQETRTATTP